MIGNYGTVTIEAILSTHGAGQSRSRCARWVAKCGSIFAGGSRGVEGACATLLKIYCENAASGPFNVPVVRLGVGRYTHRTFGIVKVPEFPVVKWADPATGETAASPAGKGAGNGKTSAPGPWRPSWSDDIPF